MDQNDRSKRYEAFLKVKEIVQAPKLELSDAEQNTFIFAAEGLLLADSRESDDVKECIHEFSRLIDELSVLRWAERAATQNQLKNAFYACAPAEVPSPVAA